MRTIYKILTAAERRHFEAEGCFAGAPVDRRDGYIHLSTADQLRATAHKHFAGQSDLVLVAIDAGRLGDGLRYEPARGGDLFPHLYGVLPRAAVLWMADLPLGPDGRHVFPDLSP